MATYSTSVPLGWTIASKLLKKVHVRLGLQNCQVLITGGAPIHRDTLEYLMSVQLPVMEMYGMSESSGLHSANALDNWRLGSVGKTLSGRKTKIVDPDENGEGEVSSGKFCSEPLLLFMVFADLYVWPPCVHGLPEQ